MASKLVLYNHSLLLVRAKKLTALTDDVHERYTLDDVYDSAVADALAEGAWNFGTRTVAIEHSVSVQPAFGYSFAFEKPDDWVRTVCISSNGNFWPPLGPDGFADETTNWHADCAPLYVSYVSDGAIYGMNLGNWPASFENYVEHELALRIAPHITAMSETAIRELERKRDRALRNARSKDALNQASMMPPPGRMVMARRGGLWRQPWRSKN